VSERRAIMRGAERHRDLLTAEPVDDRKASWDWWIGPLAMAPRSSNVTTPTPFIECPLSVRLKTSSPDSAMRTIWLSLRVGAMHWLASCRSVENCTPQDIGYRLHIKTPAGVDLPSAMRWMAC
jgi:hypothetical protein